MTSSVAVITPSIVSPKLLDAIESVSKQTYANIRHIVVVDGQEYHAKWDKFCQNFCEVVSLEKIDTIYLPHNTGKTNGNWYGHRIYAALPLLLNHDYIAFLDEDNWYEPNHIESLVNTIEGRKRNYHKNDLVTHVGLGIDDFAYSLRKIYDQDKNFVVEDKCESLGKWPIWFTHDTPQYLIDTSSFLFKRDFIQKHSINWFYGWGGDRQFFYSVKDKAKFQCSREYSLCYRLDGNENSVSPQFFIEGNKKQEQHYKGNYPWQKDYKDEFWDYSVKV